MGINSKKKHKYTIVIYEFYFFRYWTKKYQKIPSTNMFVPQLTQVWNGMHINKNT